MAELEIPVRELPNDTAQPTATEQVNPAFRIVVNGQDLAKNKFTQRVLKVVVEERDDGADMAQVIFLNAENKFTNDPLFQEGSKMTVWLGQQGSELIQRGVFYLKRPQFRYAQNGRSTVLLEGVGETIRMAQEERVRSWEKHSDATLARAIANEYGWKADVEDTQPAHSMIVQPGITDYRLLANRAMLHGFQLWVRNGVLHFHRVRDETSEVVLNYRVFDQANVASFEIRVDSWLSGVEAGLSRYDPLSGKIWTVTSSQDLDAVTKAEEKRLRNEEFRNSSAISGAPLVGLPNIGHELTKDEGQELVDSLAGASRYVVKAVCVCRGDVRLTSGRTVQVNGVQKFSGTYYIKGCCHEIENGYHKTTLSLRRALTGELTISPSIALSDSVAAGVRDVSSASQAGLGVPSDDLTPSIESAAKYDDRNGRFVNVVP
jgi:hypothetical protein